MRWREIGVLVASLSVLVCVGGRHDDAPATDGNADPVLADMGAETYQQHCASCHGITAEGDGPVAPSLMPPPPDLTRIAARRTGSFPDGEIARMIDGRFAVPAHGPRDMPVWGQRFGEAIPESGVAEEVVRGQIAVLVEYLKSIQRSE